MILSVIQTDLLETNWLIKTQLDLKKEDEDEWYRTAVPGGTPCALGPHPSSQPDGDYALFRTCWAHLPLDLCTCSFLCLDCICHLCDFLFGKIVHHLFLTFKILMHLEFIWVCKGSDFIFFQMDIHLCQHHGFYNLPFPTELKYSLCHIYIFSYILESIFGCSIIFHLSIPLPVPYWFDYSGSIICSYFQ